LASPALYCFVICVGYYAAIAIGLIDKNHGNPSENCGGGELRLGRLLQY